MQRAYQVTGIVFLLIALFLGYHAVGLRYYTSLGPGPGFFPVWLCVLLGLLAAAFVVQAWFATPEPLPEGFFASRTGYFRILVVLIGLFTIPAVISTLGFRLTMLAFYLVLLTFLGRRNPIEIIVLAIAGSFGAFKVFELLSQPLPVGMFGI
jgi:putative tricarboxylic transport membrane protein